MKKVLVTAIGTMTSTAIVRQLKRLGAYYVFGVNSFPRELTASSCDVDEFHQFPCVSDEGDAYIEFVLEFCVKHGINYYFASIDEEVELLSRYRDRFDAINVRLCIPDHNTVMLCHHKLRFEEFIEREMGGIAIKRYESIDFVQNSDYPIFVKPDVGRSSAGCAKLQSPIEWGGYLDRMKQHAPFVIQEYLEGDHITVDMIRNGYTGQMTSLQRKEWLRNANGCGVAVEILNDARLTDICNQLMLKLKLSGVVNAEFFKCKNGYRIIEINPRFSAGTEYSCLSGLDTVINAIYLADGKPCDFGEPEYGARFAKRYETIKL